MTGRPGSRQEKCLHVGGTCVLPDLGAETAGAGLRMSESVERSVNAEAGVTEEEEAAVAVCEFTGKRR